MFCPNCGQENDDANKFCKGCGINLSAGENASADVPTANDVSQNATEVQSNEQVNLHNPDRVFTDSKYTQMGGFVAYLAYSAIAVAAIVAVLFGVAGISTYSGTSMLNSFMEPLTKPLEYIDKYENLENKFDSNYTDEMHEKYQAQSITSALSDFTDLMNYVSLMLILFAIAQAFLG